MQISLSRLVACHVGRCLGLFAILVVGVGCRPSEPGAAGSSSVTEPRLASVTEIADRGDPQIRLREVFRRYQVCSYYSDDAKVILQTPSDWLGGDGAGSNASLRTGMSPQLGIAGEDSQSASTLTAPLRVQLDARLLQVDAYATRVRVNVSSSRAGVDEVELRAWFDEPETSNFDSQVLYSSWTAPSQSRLRLERLFVDEVLRSRLLAGSAGAPPQLEWLLADDPMSKLFATDHNSKASFAWLDDGRIGRDVLQRIQVTADQERFVFWIEAATSLIRRVELPLPMELRQLGGEWRLTVELKDATFQPKSSGDVPFAKQPSFRSILVDAFVPIPPPPPSPLIGKKIDESSIGRGTRDCRLIAVVPEVRDQSAGIVQLWSQVLPTFGDLCSFDLITSDSSLAKQFGSFPSPPVNVHKLSDVESLVRKLRLSANAFVVVNREGEVVLFEPTTDWASLNRALAVVQEVDSGTNVAAKVRRNYELLLDAYRKDLKRHALPNP